MQGLFAVDEVTCLSELVGAETALLVRADRTAILTLRGEVTAERLDELSAALAPVFDTDDVRELVVNLAEVPLIVAAAIPVLHRVRAVLESRRGSLVLLEAPAHVQRVLRICGLVGEGPEATVASVTDGALAAGVQAHSVAAFTVLRRRHHRSLAHLAARYVGETVAEDVVDDVLVAFWHAPERYDPGRSAPPGYLRMRVRGAAIDRLRSDKSRRDRERLETKLEHHVEWDVAELVVAAARAESVRLAVDRLPELERTVVETAFFGDHSYRQVAHILRLPEGTVKSRMRGALRRLRHDLDRADI